VAHSKDKMIKITNFSIKKLFGFMNVSIPIVDNRIIITGVNGTGKTTILTMLFYVMTGNWIKLLEFTFDEISLEIDNKEYKIIKEKLKPRFKDLEKHISFFRRRTPLSSTDSMKIIESFLLNDFNETKLIEFAKKLEIPARYLFDFKEEFFSNDLFEKNDAIINIKKIMKDFSKIHFLPTFRRIEKDLKEVIEFSNDDSDERHRNSSLRRDYSFKHSSSLINFGMEDVSQRISNFLEKLKDNKDEKRAIILSEVSNDLFSLIGMTTTITDDDLKLVQKAQAYEQKELENAFRLLKNIKESSNKKQAEQAMLAIRQFKEKSIDTTNLSPIYASISKLCVQLVEANSELNEKEKPLYNFAKICTEYLSDSGKIVKYDNQNYTFDILSENKHKVELKSLSSGEKQILSIFSDLYLGEYENFAFIIDEPELSLSVRWQERFLTDILNTGKCSFLMAVTHSPFIYDNELDDYAVDITSVSKA
jgi:hypothetical protein